MKKTIKAISLSLMALVFFSACDEDALANLEAETEERVGNHVLNLQANALYFYNVIDGVMRNRTFINTDSVFYQGIKAKRVDDNTITLDFGTGTTGYDNITRSGMLTVLQTDDYENSGAVISATFNNFFADDLPYVGSISIENLGNDTYTLDFSTFSINNEFEINSNQTIAWTKGYDTDTVGDDAFEITGSLDGKEALTGTVVTTKVGDKFVYDKSCEYGMVQGTMSVTFAGDSIKFENGVIDFIEDDGCLNLFNLQLEEANGGDIITLTKSFEGF